MSTRGIYGFLVDGKEKVAYRHCDCYMSGLGKDMIDFVRSTTDEELIKIARRIKLVSYESKPTEKQMDECKAWYQNPNDSGKEPADIQMERDWHWLLSGAAYNLNAYREGCRYMQDESDTLRDSSDREWAYIINLDSKAFEVYHWRCTATQEGRYANNGEGFALIAAFAIDELRAISENEISEYVAMLGHYEFRQYVGVVSGKVAAAAEAAKVAQSAAAQQTLFSAETSEAESRIRQASSLGRSDIVQAVYDSMVVRHFNSDDIDEARLADLVKRGYSKLGRRAPKIVVFDSPYGLFWTNRAIERISLGKDLGGDLSRLVFDPSLLARDWTPSPSGYMEDWLLWKELTQTPIGNMLENSYETLTPISRMAEAPSERSDVDVPRDATLRLRFKRSVMFRKERGYHLTKDGPGIVDQFNAYLFAAAKDLADGTSLSKHLSFAKEFMEAGVFASRAFEKYFFACRRPSVVKFDAERRLHCEDGPAIAWRDGTAMYCLHGVRVPKEIVLTAAEELPQLLLTTKNAEVRREIVRKAGIERIMQVLGGKVLDQFDYQYRSPVYGDATIGEDGSITYPVLRYEDKTAKYELVTLDVPGMDIRPTYLKMINPSTGTYHLEGVPPKIMTCREALEWRVGGCKWAPEQLT